MIRVAIVEDEPDAAALLQENLQQYSDRKGQQFSVTRFNDAIKFLENYRPQYDIVFMDIELPDLDGMAAAVRLREKDSDIIIVFVTNMSQYAVKGYAVGALDFIVKPVGYYGLAMILDKAVKNLKINAGDDIVVTADGALKRIPSAEIMYIEVLNHNLIFHTTEENYKMRGSLKEYEEKLKPRYFIRCNSCYLINPRHIKNIKNYIVQVGSDELAISHPRKKEFMKEISEYFGLK